MKKILFYFLVLLNILVIINIYFDKKETINYISVEIKGAVKNPNVYKLKESSIVLDLIKLSGGLLDNADISVTNQSKILKDEMVVVIYTKEEIEEMRKGSTAVKYIEKECVCPKIQNDSCLDKVIYNSDGIIIDKGKVSLNSATLKQLTSLPGIGESKALKIIEYRDLNNGFSSIEEIMKVSGIGPSLYEKIKDYLVL